jgi:hypothetical protein
MPKVGGSGCPRWRLWLSKVGGSGCPRWEALAAQGGQIKIKGLTFSKPEYLEKTLEAQQRTNHNSTYTSFQIH